MRWVSCRCRVDCKSLHSGHIFAFAGMPPSVAAEWLWPLACMTSIVLEFKLDAFLKLLVLSAAGTPLSLTTAWL